MMGTKNGHTGNLTGNEGFILREFAFSRDAPSGMFLGQYGVSDIALMVPGRTLFCKVAYSIYDESRNVI
jgi:hypothetical protein